MISVSSPPRKVMPFETGTRSPLFLSVALLPCVQTAIVTRLNFNDLLCFFVELLSQVRVLQVLHRWRMSRGYSGCAPAAPGLQNPVAPCLRQSGLEVLNPSLHTCTCSTISPQSSSTRFRKNIPPRTELHVVCVRRTA